MMLAWPRVVAFERKKSAIDLRCISEVESTGLVTREKVEAVKNDSQVSGS